MPHSGFIVEVIKMFRHRSHRLVAVDIVPNVLHVETRVDCLELIPLRIPESQLVVHPGERDEQRIALPLSKWSIFVAILRAKLAFVAALATLLAVVGLLSQGQLREMVPVWSAVLLVSLPLFLFSLFSRNLVRASYERAQELAELANLNAAVRLEIDVAFGLLTTDQAVNELKRRDRKRSSNFQGVDTRVAQLFSSTW